MLCITVDELLTFLKSSSDLKNLKVVVSIISTIYQLTKSFNHNDNTSNLDHALDTIKHFILHANPIVVVKSINHMPALR